jgi:hypothetical protein
MNTKKMKTTPTTDTHNVQNGEFNFSELSEVFSNLETMRRQNDPALLARVEEIHDNIGFVLQEIKMELIAAQAVTSGNRDYMDHLKTIPAFQGDSFRARSLG